MPAPPFDSVTSLIELIKIHLARGAHRERRDQIEHEVEEWSKPYIDVLETLWAITGDSDRHAEEELAENEKRKVVGELRSLLTEVEKGKITVKNLPTLSSHPFTEISTCFALSKFSLAHYIAALYNLYLGAPRLEYDGAEAWSKKAKKELKDILAGGWRSATLKQKKKAVEELAARYEAIRRVPEKD
ncbi:hypothetical protein JCM11251_000774 [Rhodosporidiobolus azoricus]